MFAKLMNRKICLFVGVLLSGHLIANGKECNWDQLTSSNLVKKYSEGNLLFAFDMYKNAPNGVDNAIISPFSIGVALAMTSAGAEGNTLRQMWDTLHLIKFSDENHVHRAIHSVLNSVCSTPDYTLSTANRMYVHKDFAIKAPFRNTLTESYESSAETADFKAKADQEAKNINSWVEQQTQNHIKDLIVPGRLDNATVLLLVNAIYFKGNWITAFPKNNTIPEDFKLASGSKISNPMMKLKGNFKYADSEQLKSQVIVLPYKGNRMLMYVILPKEVNGINRLKEQLTADFFKSINNKMEFHDVTVKLPKFKLNSKQGLSKALSQMGMGDLFDGGIANLTGIAQPRNGKLHVSMVMHQASVSVDEEGTPAAAATGVRIAMPLYSLHIRPPPIDFIADHPFIFVIYDKLTELIFFIGSVDDPSK